MIIFFYFNRSDFDQLTGNLYSGHILNMHLTLMRGDPSLPIEETIMPPPSSTTSASSHKTSTVAKVSTSSTISSKESGPGLPNIHEIGKPKLHFT